MRISTQQIFNTSLNGILNGQTQLNDLQEQIASGKKIETPADDPVASPQIVAINQQISLTEQYRNNGDLAKGRLQLEESILDGFGDTIQRVRELTIQAGDGALSVNERQAISIEIKERLEQLVGYANTRDSNGQYIFAGFQSGQAPIVQGATGGYTYQGDEGQLYIKIADSIDVAASDSGKSLFMDVDEPLNFSAAPNAGNTGAVVVNNQVVLDQQSFDAFHPDGATITFDATGPGISYTVTRVSDGSVISGGNPAAPLSNVSYIAGDQIEFEGVHIDVSGIPANGDTIDVASLAAGKLDIFSALEQLTIGLDSLDDSSGSQLQVGELIADALISLDSTLDNVLETRAEVGGRLNVIDDALANNDNMDLIGRQVLSDIQDLDYADALSRLSLQSFILEASQSTFATITNLSLFNYIR